jgi:hypothetical protein
MKHLTNDELTQSTIFSDLDSVIEGAITDLFAKHKLDPDTQPDYLVFDITNSLPLSDPGNEKAFLIKITPDLDQDTHYALWDDLQKIDTQTALKANINSQLGSEDSDFLGMLESIFTTNADIFMLFTYCR